MAGGAVGRDGFFFFNDTATTEIYTLSLHDALPILGPAAVGGEGEAAVAVRPGGGGLGREAGLALVDIGDGEGAAGGEVAAAVDRDILLDAAARHPADHRHVVGAGDGDGDGQIGRAHV